MQISVLLEPVGNNGYRANSGPPLALSAEGATRAEAVHNLDNLMRQRLTRGVEVAVLEVAVAAAKNPWIEFAGMFENDPLFEDWQKAIEEYRREVHADFNNHSPAS